MNRRPTDFAASTYPLPQANGGAGAFDDLFGNGALGDVTINVVTPGFIGGDYTNFTLGPLGLLTPPLGQGIIIRARNKITIHGAINANGSIPPITGPGSPAALTMGDLQSAANGGAGGGGGGATGNGQSNFGGGGGGGGGPNIGYIVGTSSSPGNNGQGGAPTMPGFPGTDATGVGVAGGPSPWLLQVLRFPTWRVFAGGVGGQQGQQGPQGGQGGPGGGGNGGNGGNGGAGGPGGAGGATILLMAPIIELDPAAQLLSNGLFGGPGGAGGVGQDAGLGTGGGGGGAGGGGGGGQGGCGGLIYLLTQALSDPGPCTKSALGGTGGAFGTGALGGAGDGAGAVGGVSGKGAVGAAGSVGIVFTYIL